MAKQCLGLVFAGLEGLEVVTRRMLHDHTKEKFGSTNDQELVRETRSVETTNIESERDYAMLDRLMKLKSKALDLVYGGPFRLSEIRQMHGGTI